MQLEKLEKEDLIAIITRLTKELNTLRLEHSWCGYVDTQSGAFTQDEIDRSRNW